MEIGLKNKILKENDYNKVLKILKKSSYNGDLDEEVIEHIGKIGNLEDMQYNYYPRKKRNFIR